MIYRDSVSASHPFRSCCISLVEIAGFGLVHNIVAFMLEEQAWE